MKKLKKLPDREIDPVTLSFWHDISKNPCLTKLLNYCEENYKGKYKEETPESIHSHIQQERNGGQKGWNKLQSLLLNPPDISVTEKSTTKKKFTQPEFGFSHTE